MNKLNLPKNDSCIILTKDWTVSQRNDVWNIKKVAEGILNATKIPATLGKEKRETITVPVGTVIQFKSMYIGGGEDSSIILREGPFTKMTNRIHISVESLNDIEFEPHELKKIKQTNPVVSWTWPDYGAPEVGNKYNKIHSHTIEKIDETTVKWCHRESATGYIIGKRRDDWRSHDFRSDLIVYADYTTKQVPLPGNIGETTAVEFIVTKVEWHVYDTQNDKLEFLGIAKNKDAVRKIVNELVKKVQ
jgi:hypothetical protein